MATVYSEPFSELGELDSRFAEVKRAGMKFLGIPESLEDSTHVKPEAISLFWLQRGAKVRVAFGSLDVVRSFVLNHRGHFVLAVTF